MLKNIYTKIVINSVYEIKYFSSLEIKSDINNLTSVCNILLPSNNIFVDNNSLTYSGSSEDIVFKIGDKIEVMISYYEDADELFLIENSSIPLYFIGYLNGFSINDVMVEIKSEDSMYLFKSKKMKFSSNDASLIELVNGVVEKTIDITEIIPFEPEYISQGDIKLGKFTSNDYLSGGQVFSEIKQKYNLFFYFKNIYTKTLIAGEPNYNTEPYFFAGLKYPIKNISNLVKTINFTYPFSNSLNPDDVNFYNPIITNQLNYETFDKNKLIITGEIKKSSSAKSLKYAYCLINEKPTFIEKEVEIKKQIDLKENKIELKGLSNMTKSSLYLILKETFDNYPESGFKGTFTCFAEPMVRIGDIVNLYIENGSGLSKPVEQKYYVDAVNVNVNKESGATQTITLGNKIK